jgi:hypothetical protein
MFWFIEWEHKVWKVSAEQMVEKPLAPLALTMFSLDELLKRLIKVIL